MRDRFASLGIHSVKEHRLVLPLTVATLLNTQVRVHLLVKSRAVANHARLEIHDKCSLRCAHIFHQPPVKIACTSQLRNDSM